MLKKFLNASVHVRILFAANVQNFPIDYFTDSFVTIVRGRFLSGFVISNQQYIYPIDVSLFENFEVSLQEHVYNVVLYEY